MKRPDPDYEPSALLAQWRNQTPSLAQSGTDPADIICEREQRAERLAALQTFVTLDKLSGNKYGQGLRYLFALHIGGQSAEDIARLEGSTTEKINQIVRDTCQAMRPVLAPLLLKPDA